MYVQVYKHAFIFYSNYSSDKLRYHPATPCPLYKLDTRQSQFAIVESHLNPGITTAWQFFPDGKIQVKWHPGDEICISPKIKWFILQYSQTEWQYLCRISNLQECTFAWKHTNMRGKLKEVKKCRRENTLNSKCQIFILHFSILQNAWTLETFYIQII